MLAGLATLVIAGTGVLGFGATRLTLLLLGRFGVIDVPNERSSHRRPVIRGAGMGVAAVWLVATLLMAVLLADASAALPLVAMVAGLSLLGFIDDLHHRAPALRLASQVLVCGAAVALGLGTRDLLLPGLPPVGLAVAAIPLWTAAVVLVVNLFNFMDGIDGLAASQTLLAALALSVGGLLAGWPFLALAAAALAGAIGGFLPFNWQPARCFMGDAGSYFCGGALAGLWIIGQRHGLSPVVEALPAGAFLLDAVLTLGWRALAGDRVWQPHRAHLYQRLVDRGWSHARVVKCYLAVGVVTATASLILLGVAHV